MDVDKRLVEQLLISDVSYVVAVSPAHPKPTQPGEFYTGLRNALFMEAAVDGLKDKRQPVAGVVVFGLGVSPLNVVGVINERAHRSFDPRLLRQISFAEAVVLENRVGIRWHNEKSRAD